MILPFHEWKSWIVLFDSVLHGVDRHDQPRDWYYTAYGKYCEKERRLADKLLKDKEE